jgi:signal transduction histidine kinase
MQNEFIAVVSHEFRTPMAVINSSSRLIKANIEQVKKTLNSSSSNNSIQESIDLHFSKINQQLSNIDLYINRLSNLIEGTLQMCSLDGKKSSDYLPTSVNLENEITSIINNLRNVKDSVKVNLELIGRDHRIFFDNKHLHLILSNLISNALKYSHDNSQVLVQISSSDEDSVLKITDYGIGIPKDEMDKLFSKFFRASNAKSLFGTGIGLYVSKKLIELNSAKIEVESRENQGTTFTVTFPKYLAQSNFKEVANG